MKNNVVYLILSLIILSSTLSCNNDDDSESIHELVGTWQRVEFSDTFEEKFTFNSDNTGIHFFHDGSFTNTQTINWSTQENELYTTGENNIQINFTYIINSEGQLVLDSDSELTYNRI
ncbi:hypothetical protein [Ichthyenterobacterium magnum]|uniref:Lipocalin-like domain-containing protein n=1 Tax=Ichthyenterobacterium magnum TaxID=1230530 RepID=A0A420DV30_9FLAO|nr:hypothetical protein [Ichthyenterobacterium magnum]RKE98039.1 hypothetical protein BXY80_0104 [Ichthyenterobacterium magnum]